MMYAGENTMVVEDALSRINSIIERKPLEPVSYTHLYLPRYTNKAVNFTGDDMGSDKATIMLFDYIVVVVIAFVFAVTTVSYTHLPCSSG